VSKHASSTYRRSALPADTSHGPDDGSDPHQDGKVAGLSLYDLINQVEGL
jgi:hypothetical protein